MTDEATLGATTSEIVNRLGINIADAAVVIADLAKCGLITDSKQRRRNPDNGQMEIVWLTSAAGKRAAFELRM
jgi:hypothetical protein